MKKDSLFDVHGDQYEQWFRDHDHAYRSELQAIRSLLPQSGRGMEVGVGSGLFAAPLGITEGVDPSRVMRELAWKLGINASSGVAENLPYQPGVFQYVLMVTTVCFLDDLDLAFQEVYRVLAADGCFIIGFVEKNSPIGKAYREQKNESLFYRDATFYAVDDLLTHLRAAGFDRFDFRQTLFVPIDQMTEPSPVLDGYDKGSFVVIRAWKGSIP